VVGADRVARFLLGALRKSVDLVADLETGAGETRLVLRREGGVAAVASFSVEGERVSRVWLVLNPDKLGTWEPHTPDDHAVEQA
jgi:RNA polymerase sigma-70 factor (ECF subfamily)